MFRYAAVPQSRRPPRCTNINLYKAIVSNDSYLGCMRYVSVCLEAMVWCPQGPFGVVFKPTGLGVTFGLARLLER